MNTALVMTLIGQDRPGLVELLAHLVAEHEGNWLESRMSRLGGQFAGILRVQVPARLECELVQALQNLQHKGLTVVVHPDTPATSTPAGRSASLDLVGQDRPGIVREISRALAGAGINVEELQTECSSAPMSGETLFTAHASLHIPANADLKALRQRLEKIAGDLMVEIKLGELNPP